MKKKKESNEFLGGVLGLFLFADRMLVDSISVCCKLKFKEVVHLDNKYYPLTLSVFHNLTVKSAEPEAIIDPSLL